MNEITYSLKTDKKFYETLRVFTDLMAQTAEKQFGFIIDDYLAFINHSKIEEARTRDEYLFELVMIGVLSRHYLPFAVLTPSPAAKALHKLVNLRTNYPKLKPAVDYMRGIGGTLFLTRQNSKKTFATDRTNFGKLLRWLDATGDFKQESKRLHNWKRFFAFKSEIETASILARSHSFARIFIETGKNILGDYTKNIEQFRHSKLPSYKWKEDYIFCGRRESEYHLNMFGSEIMNRAFKDKFEKTKTKVLLAPSCMRNKPDEECKAIRNGFDISCTGCTKDCNINKYRELGIEEGFGVAIIPHSSDFSKWLERWSNSEVVGVIGVACVLNLLTGGYETKALNIPAQCVFLDYCGCTNHWDKKGIPTDLNKFELLKTLTHDNQEEVSRKLLYSM